MTPPNPATCHLTCGNSQDQTPQNPAEPQVSQPSEPRKNPASNPHHPRIQTPQNPAESDTLAGFETNPETLSDLLLCGVAGFCGVCQAARHDANQLPGAQPPTDPPGRTSKESKVTALSVHTLSEAAVLLRVKESWLERQAAARKIPFSMLGGSYRFTADHLAEIVRINEKRPAAEPEPIAVPRTRHRRNDMSSVTQLRPRPEGRRNGRTITAA